MREELSNDLERNGAEAESGIARLIGELPKVEAPADFDIKVRARIAERRSAASRGFAWLRLAAPVAGLALIIGIFAFAGYLRIGDDVAMVTEPAQVEPVAVRPDEPAMVSTPVANTPTVERVAPANMPAAIVPGASRPPADESIRKKPADSNGDYLDDEGAGSTDTSLRPPRSIEVPSEVRPSPQAAPNVLSSRKPRSSGGLSLAQALSFAGVSVDSSGGRFVVASVGANSPGGRSGLRAGDVIEAVNDRPFAAGEEFSEIKSVTLNRGGQRVRIELRFGQ